MAARCRVDPAPRGTYAWAMKPRRASLRRRARLSSPVRGDGFARRLDGVRRRLEPRFPDIDPAELELILERLLRPKTVPLRFLLREIRPGVFVP